MGINKFLVKNCVIESKEHKSSKLNPNRRPLKSHFVRKTGPHRRVWRFSVFLIICMLATNGLVSFRRGGQKGVQNGTVAILLVNRACGA